MEDALSRLDNLTHEAQMATAEVQRAAHAVDETVAGVTEQAPIVDATDASVHDKDADVINGA